MDVIYSLIQMTKSLKYHKVTFTLPQHNKRPQLDFIKPLYKVTYVRHLLELMHPRNNT